MTRLIGLFALTLYVAFASLVAPAQKTAPVEKAEPAFEPSVGQKGKDLGSGDGRTVITAAKRGIRALGVEYDPRMVELSRRNAEKEGVTGLAKFVKADLFETDFSKATVITMFLLPEINVKLRPRILAGTHKAAQGEGKAIPVEGKVIGDEVVLAADGREVRAKVRGKRLTLG